MNNSVSLNVGSRSGLKIFGTLLVVVFFIPMVIFNIQGSSLVFESPILLALLNTIFLFIIPLAIAVMAAKSHQTTNIIAFLLIGCGFVFFGVSSLYAGWVMPLAGGPNPTVTLHNIGSLFAGICQFAGAHFFLLELAGVSKTRSRFRGYWILYASIAVLVSITAFLAFKGNIPVFFDPVSGASSLRQLVLGAAICLFAVAGLVFMEIHVTAKTEFAFWYALALWLIAIGLTCVMLQRSVGSELGWIGRGAQYAGSFYFIFAFFQGRKELRTADSSSIIKTRWALWPYLAHLVEERTTTLNRAHRAMQNDITERKQAEAALKESEARFRSLFDDSPISLWEEDFSAVKQRLDALQAAGVNDFNAYFAMHPEIVAQYAALVKVLDVNKATLALYGATSKEDLVKNLAVILPEDGNEQFCNELVMIASGALHFEMEQINQTLNGKQKLVNLNWAVVPGHESDLSRTIVSLIDITERKKAEEDLHASEERYRLMYERSPLGYQSLDADGRFIEVNQSWLDTLGYQRQEVMGHWFGDFLVPEMVDAFRERFPLFKAAGEVHNQFHMVHKKGNILTIAFDGKIGYDEKGLFKQTYCIINDITVRKKIEEALQESEKRFKLALQNAPLPIMLHAEDGEVLMISQSWSELTGYTLDDIPTTSIWANKAYGERNQAVKTDIDNLYGLQGRKNEGEYLVQTKDGRNLTWDFSSSMLGSLPDGRRLVISMAMDVTARKKVDEALRTSELYYSSLFNNMLNGIAYCQMLYENNIPRDFIYLDVNNEFEKITGLKNVIGKKVTELIPGIRESDPKLFEIYGRVAMTGSPEVFKTYIEGLRDWYSISISSPRQGYFVAVFDVITASKQAEENLKKSEQQFRALFEQAAVGVAITDAQSGEFLKINQRYCEILGYSTEEIKGLTFQTITHPDDVQISLEKMQLLLSGTIRKFSIEKRYIRKDGTVVWVDMTVASMWEPEDAPTGYVTIIQDITERKQAGEQITSLVERFDLATRAAHLGVWDWDIVNNHLVWDDYMYELYGVKKENFAGAYEAWLEGIHPDDRTDSDKISQQAQRGEREYDPEFRVVWPNGTVHWLKAYGHFTRGADGQPLHMIGVNYDITERKQTEKALRESEERLRLFIEFAPASLAMFDRRMVYQAVSQRWITDYHLEGQEILEKSYYFIFPEISEEWKEIHRRGMTGEVIKCEEDKFVRMDGSIQWLKWEVRPWFKDDRTVGGIIIFSEDITEYKQVEEKINVTNFELQRLFAEADESRQVLLNVVEDQKIAEEKLSQLNIELEQRVRERTTELEAANQELEAFSYSVSHDLRAPLRGIDGWSSVLMDDYRDQLDEKGRQSLGRVRSETQRMGQLIDDMLRLSRVTRAEMKRGPVNLSELALSIAARLQEETPQQHAQFIIQPELNDLGDPNSLEIMLTNLLSNAWKFSGKQPQPVIEFGKSLIDGKLVYFVRDNGAGFDMAYAKNLFGAFQRMHKQSDFPGTGIGLATVQRIIHRHGGKVWAEASKNAGATFYFTLQETA